MSTSEVSSGSSLQITDLKISQLKRDFLSHAKFIYILYNEAKMEQWVKDEIQNIESALPENVPKIGNSHVGGDYPPQYITNMRAMKKKFVDLYYATKFLGFVGNQTEGGF